MKKVKFMLLSLALVAVVGGALAFKAKSGNQFCTTLASTFGVAGAFTCVDPADANATLHCPNLLINRTTGGSAGNFVCTTIVPVNGCGTDNPICDAPTQRTKAE